MNQKKIVLFPIFAGLLLMWFVFRNDNGQISTNGNRAVANAPINKTGELKIMGQGLTPNSALETRETEFRNERVISHAKGLVDPNLNDLSLNPTIVISNGVYSVTFGQKANPFRSGKYKGSSVYFDAETGDLIKHSAGQGGVEMYTFSRQTGASYKTRKEAQKKVHEALVHLDSLAKQTGKFPESNSKRPQMIAPGDAIKTTVSYLSGRENIDLSTDPLVILIDDIYIVIYWKSRTENLPRGWPLYDVRIGIDAYTGEYIAMEQTEP